MSTEEPAAQGEPIMVVLQGSPTPEESAAVEAVLLAHAEEWAETKHRRVLDTESRWQRKARSATGSHWHRD